MKKLDLVIGGEKLRVTAAKGPGGKLWIHYNGETYTHETLKARTRGAKGAGAVAFEILAPMPGKIIKVDVSANDAVKAGQVLLVMEAMKMEYTLKAQADGVIETVLCEPNAQVALGQMLVKLKKP